jgi:hypothetical protein
MSSKYFTPGDLLHIPEGTVLYDIIRVNMNGGLYPAPIPKQVIRNPTVALVIEKNFNDYYLVSIKDQQYLINGESVNIYNEDLQHAY